MGYSAQIPRLISSIIFLTILSHTLGVSSRNSHPSSRLDDKSLQFYKNGKENVIPFYLRDQFLSGRIHEKVYSGDLFIGVKDRLCIEHTGFWFDHIEYEEIRWPWTVQMMDAWGKFPSGVYSGHTATPGDYPECLQIKVEYDNADLTEHSSFVGRYCAAYVFPNEDRFEEDNDDDKSRKNPSSKIVLEPEELVELIADENGLFMYPFLGTCFPSSCDVDDSQILLENIFKNWTEDTYYVPSIIECYTEEGNNPPYNTGEIVMISVLSLIGFLCIVGTLVDVLIRRRENIQSMIGTVIKVLVAFSIYTNTKKWVNTRANADNFGCLHGLRFLSMAWVVLCHSFAVLAKFQFTWNAVDLKKMYSDNWTIAAVMNGTVSVDTFFVMGGALVAYNVLKVLDKQKGKINIPLMYIHRFCRLTPTYAIIVGIMATLLSRFGSAPAWFLLDIESKNCEKNWWHNILYINNLVTYGPTNGICYGESWYLSNDMQFYILSPFLVWPLWKRPMIGKAILGVLSILSIAAPTVVTWVKELPPTLIPFIPPGGYMNDLYIRPWTRIGPYLVGLFLGYILYLKAKNKSKGERRLSKIVVLAAWFLSTCVGMVIVFGAHPFFDPENVHETTTGWVGTLYSGVHRYIWAVMIAWIIFACIHGYGGWINDFLSWSAFIPLGRLTFCVYITSYHLQMIFHLLNPTPMRYSVYTTVNYFFAHMVMSLFVGYILTITLESPFMQLEKLIFQRDRPPRPPQSNVPPTNVSQNDGTPDNYSVPEAVTTEGAENNNTQNEKLEPV